MSYFICVFLLISEIILVCEESCHCGLYRDKHANPALKRESTSKWSKIDDTATQPSQYFGEFPNEDSSSNSNKVSRRNHSQVN